MSSRRVPLEERFWSKVTKTEDCWEWSASRDNKGYGKIGVGGHGGGWVGAHRVSYELEYGPFDADLCVLHRCDNTSCVRPDHLFLGTRGDNARDMVAKGRSRGQKQTECKYGHVFVEGSFYITNRGGRRCKPCEYARYRARRARAAVAA